MINVQIPRTVAAVGATTRLWRPKAGTFWMMLALEGILVLGALLFLLNRTPTTTPLADLDAVQQVRTAILSGGPSDPLIQAAPGIEARASNLRGLRLNGQTYYYYFEGRDGYDPLSRGAIARENVELLLRDEGGSHPLVIYRILGS